MESLHSFGYVKASNKAEGRTERDCTYYFYILTWWIDGIPLYQEAFYLGSICATVDCDDPNNETLCPDDGGSGGGGVGDWLE